VILHRDAQLQDLKHFCCSALFGEKTVLAFDKKFNPTEVHVTMAVYRERIQNHPVMMGPMFIHGISDYETYGIFFDYLKRILRQKINVMLGVI